jgi:hypothetical protein
LKESGKNKAASLVPLVPTDEPEELPDGALLGCATSLRCMHFEWFTDLFLSYLTCSF